MPTPNPEIDAFIADADRWQDGEVPAELEERFEDDVAYREAFEARTPGRQKSWMLYFGGAKRAETRERRIEKYRSKVLEGKGYNER